MSTSSRGGSGGGRGRGGRGGGRGNAPRGPQSLVGRGGGRGGGTAPAASSATGMASEHVLTTGVKRPGYGSSGTAVSVYTNHFEVNIPNAMIHHYDGTWLHRRL